MPLSESERSVPGRGPIRSEAGAYLGLRLDRPGPDRSFGSSKGSEECTPPSPSNLTGPAAVNDPTASAPCSKTLPSLGGFKRLQLWRASPYLGICFRLKRRSLRSFSLKQIAIKPPYFSVFVVPSFVIAFEI